MDSENPNLENLLQMGRTAARQGNREGARMLLKQVLDVDKKNDRAWILMASVAEDAAKKRQYLETALRYNPNNQTARKALSQMNSKTSRRDRQMLVIGALFLFGIGVVGALLVLFALVIG
jgi:Tfp pilus assembly protein PilF